MTDLTKHRIEDQPDNPYDEAGIISKVFFFWLNPFIKKGFKQELQLLDLYKVPQENLSEDLGQSLKREWDKELIQHRQGKRASLGRAICRAFGFWYLLSGIWVTLGECIVRPLQAISLGWVIRDVNLYLSLDQTDPGQLELINSTYYQVFYDGLLLIFLSTVALITVHPYVFCTQHTGMKVRIACCHLIYRHSLKLSNAAIGQTTVGQMVNLLSNDVNRFDIALNYIQYLVIAPLQAIIAVFVLSYMYLGFYSTAAGSALLLLYVPFQSMMGRWFGKLRLATAARTDERIRLMNEIIPAMRVIKMYTWEDPFGALVEQARASEVRLIKYTSILRAINMALFFVSSKVILFICFMTYVLLGYTLEPEIVFVSITLFNAVRLFMTLFFPYGVAQLAETLISCSRLQEFLLLPEQESSHRVDRSPSDIKIQPEDVKIECLDVSANWTIVNRTVLQEDGSGADIGKRKPKIVNTTGSIDQQDSQRRAAIDGSATGSSQRLNSSSMNLAQAFSSKQRQQLHSSKNSLFASTTNVHLASQKGTTSIVGSPVGGGAGTGATSAGINQTAISALRNLSYTVKAGELLVIVGRVGSGKSSVLMSILGELPLAAGRMQIRGRLSYASQEPWIFAGTVRENVLFGKKFNATRYKDVLRACSLDRDIKLFPQGDETIVGERGVSLSGGQKARINLARAIYYDADIYLLDDPLSAVDTVVAKHIFNECIRGYLKDKAVLLATHQTQFVRKDTKVLFLQEGRQVSCRSYADNKDLQLFIGSTWEKSDSESALSSAKHTRRVSGRLLPADGRPAAAGARLSSSTQSTSPMKNIQQRGATAEVDTGTAESQPLITTADAEASAGGAGDNGSGSNTNGSGSATGSPTESGDEADGGGSPVKIAGEAPMKQHVESSSSQLVGSSIYWHYLKACAAPALILIVAISNLGTQLLFNGSDFWLSYWTDTEQRKAANGGSSDYPPVTLTDTLTLKENAIVYTVLIVGLFCLTLLRTTCFFITCMRSSINLHTRLFKSVLKAPIKFFDYNPIGILLNRVSRDMGIVDDLLPPTAFDTIEIFINVMGILITVIVIYPASALPAAALCATVVLIRTLYTRTVRSIKSIEGVTRSPVFSHLAASLNGLATIRAFGVEAEFERRFDQYQDIHSSAWFLFVAASRWLGCSLDWISLGYIGVVTIVMTLTVGTTTGSQIGLAISSALALSGSFQWGIRQSTELESQMTSVARIREYSELPEEPPRVSSEPPPPSWPERGVIEFQQVNLRYFDNEEPVLKALTFKIEAGEKVGIVGRTGAGKSSIIAVLFRLTEPEGHVIIDDIDTKAIGLHELRKKLSIIPQEPILFNGPIRRNLDPFNEYNDLDMWRALEHVKLNDVVRGLPGGLDAELSEGGGNFSVGERQLICLARAVLRKNRIIVMDEATANVDPDTDKFIQRTINETFVNCTRLTIAHRLNTIMDSDRVLVMDAGEVKEFDAPWLLLQNEDGFFSTMVKNTGKNAGHLKRVAKNHYEKRQEAAAEAAVAARSATSGGDQV
uniref:Multidrug resistance-associated protein 4 n=1 Tax=Aceria tosichella TaxID=561515 RepID=A0A6G1SI71_9ACAR